MSNEELKVYVELLKLFIEELNSLKFDKLALNDVDTLLLKSPVTLATLALNSATVVIVSYNDCDVAIWTNLPWKVLPSIL